MKIVFKNAEDKAEFMDIVNRNDAEVSFNGTTLNSDTANILNDVALDTDVEIDVDNPHSTFGIELISDLDNAGLLKEGENADLSNGWIG